MKPAISGTDKRARFVPGDEHLPVASLVDPAVAASLLRERVPAMRERPLSVRIGHIRYSPEVSCTICYHVRIGDGTREIVLYAKCVCKESYEEILHKNQRQRWATGALLPEPLSIPQYQAIVYEFPNDGRMTGLNEIVGGAKLSRIIGRHRVELVPDGWIPADREPTWQVMRYKPESRFVSLCESFWRDDQGRERQVSFLLRAERGSHSDRVFRLMQRLYAALEDVTDISVPKALFCEPRKGLTALECVSGDKLSEVLRSADAADAMAATAATLATLHRCRVARLTERAPASDLEKAARTAGLLSHSGGTIPEQAEQIVRRLADLHGSAEAGHRGFVHGDFHQGQVLCDGRAHRVLDFDQAHAGDTTADVGNFLAQVEVLQLRERLTSDVPWRDLFLSGYQRASGLRVPADRLRFWTAIRLFEVAAKEFRRLKHNWPAKVTSILNRCETILEQ